jgi:hypothetical protein
MSVWLVWGIYAAGFITCYRFAYRWQYEDTQRHYSGHRTPVVDFDDRVVFTLGALAVAVTWPAWVLIAAIGWPLWRILTPRMPADPPQPDALSQRIAELERDLNIGDGRQP